MIFIAESPLIPDIPEVDPVFYPVVKAFSVFIDLIGDHLSVPETDDPVRIKVCQVFLMCYEYDQLFAGDGLDYVHYLKGIGTVEVSGRLIRYDDGRILDYRARNADTLALSA